MKQKGFEFKDDFSSNSEKKKYQEEYETVDGVHPNKAGMHTLARMWIREMKKFICK